MYFPKTRTTLSHVRERQFVDDRCFFKYTMSVKSPSIGCYWHRALVGQTSYTDGRKRWSKLNFLKSSKNKSFVCWCNFWSAAMKDVLFFYFFHFSKYNNKWNENVLFLKKGTKRFFNRVHKLYYYHNNIINRNTNKPIYLFCIIIITFSMWKQDTLHLLIIIYNIINVIFMFDREVRRSFVRANTFIIKFKYNIKFI